MSDEGYDKTFKRYFYNGKDKPHILDWSVKVKAYGNSKGWGTRLTREFDPLQDEEMQQDMEAKSFLIGVCEGDAFRAIKHLAEKDQSATKIWTTLQEKFNRSITKDPSDLMAIKKEIKNVRVKNETDNPEDMIDALNDLWEERVKIDTKYELTDEEKIAEINERLPESKYQVFIVSENKSMMETGYTFEKYLTSLRRYYKQFVKSASGSNNESVEEEAKVMSVTKTHKKFKGRCGNCGAIGHKRKDCKSKKNSQRKCYNCGKSGHLARDCPEKKKNEQDNEVAFVGMVELVSDDMCQPVREITSFDFFGGRRWADLCDEDDEDEVGISATEVTMDSGDQLDIDTLEDNADGVKVKCDFGFLDEVSDEEWNEGNESLEVADFDVGNVANDGGDARFNNTDGDVGEIDDDVPELEWGSDDDSSVGSAFSDDSEESELSSDENDANFNIVEINENNSEVNNVEGDEEIVMLADSGSEVHIVQDKRGLVNIEPHNKTVSVGGGHRLTSTCKGDLRLQQKETGQSILVKDVLVIEEFGRNILSLGRMQRNGCRYIGDQNGARLEKDGQVLTLKQFRTNGMYYLVGVPGECAESNGVGGTEPPQQQPAAVVSDDEESLDNGAANTGIGEDARVDNSTTPQAIETAENEETTPSGDDEKPKENVDSERAKPTMTMNVLEAHQKWGHIGERELRLTAKHQSVKLTGRMTTCDGCGLAKTRRKKMTKEASKMATKPAERIFFDTAGPFTPSMGGSRFWVKAIDDMSHKSWDFFIKKKSEVPTKIERLLILLVQKGFKVEFLRCDNAGEHVEMTKIAEKYGVTLEKTGANTPQRNGVVERRFVTDFDRALAAMNTAGMSEADRGRLWPEICKTMSQMTNVVMNSRRDKPPDELFYGKPCANLLRHAVQPGRIGYVPKVKRAKGNLENRGNKCIFVGYADNHSRDTYRMYNPVTKRLTETRHVTWADFEFSRPNGNREAIPDSEGPGMPDHEDLHVRLPGKEKSSVLSPATDSDVLEGGASTSALRAGRNVAQPGAAVIPNENPEGDGEAEPGDHNDEEAKASESNNNEGLSARQQRVLRNLQSWNNDEQPNIDLDAEGVRTRSMRQQNEAENSLVFGDATEGFFEIEVGEETFVYNVELNSDPLEPKKFREAVDGPDKEKWIPSTKKEIDNFVKRKAWKKVKRKDVLAEGRKITPVKWVFKVKNEQDGSLRYKSRIVVLGFMQIPGVDYTESFSPVANDASIRTTIGYTLYRSDDGWIIDMIDVEAAFLNAELDTPAYVEFPEGIVELGYLTEEDVEEYCIMLTRAMYGNVDAPLRWMKTLIKHLKKKMGLTQSKADPCVLFKRDKEGNTILIVIIYVDDVLIAGPESEVDWFKTTLNKKWNITDLGRLKKHLGIMYEWKKDANGESIVVASMKDYEKAIVEAFEKVTSRQPRKATTPGFPNKTLTKLPEDGEVVLPTEYRSLVGKLMHWGNKLAPEACYAIKDLAQNMIRPGKEHWKALERLCGYVREVKFEGLTYRKPKELRAIAITDSNFATNPDTRKSVTGMLGTLGGTLTTWTSCNQAVVAQSSTEAEYVAMARGGQEVQFMMNLLDEVLGAGKVVRPSEIYGDNMGALFLTRNAQVSQRTKHVDIKHHFLRDMMERGDLNTKYVRTDDNPADVLTKNLREELHNKHSGVIREGRLGSWREDVERTTVTSIQQPNRGSRLKESKSDSGELVISQSCVSESGDNDVEGDHANLGPGSGPEMVEGDDGAPWIRVNYRNRRKKLRDPKWSGQGKNGGHLPG